MQRIKDKSFSFQGRRSKAAVSESESVATSEPTSETQDEGETPIKVVDEKVETEVDAEKETMENEGNDGQNGDDESATKKQEEDSVGDQQESEELEQEGNEIEEEKDESDSEIIEENDDIQEKEEVEDINEKVDENKAVEKENDSNEMEIETNGNSTQEPVSKQQAAGKENNDHNESGVGIDMEEDNFEPDFEADDNNGSKNEEISMQADSEDEIEFLAEVEADRSEIEKQRKKAIAEELTLCLICHEICNRGIIVKCCSAHACRACAMKKVNIEIVLKN